MARRDVVIPIVCDEWTTRRFWEKAQKCEESCWEWLGPRLPSGYGRLRLSGVGGIYAHRYSYALAYGPIPEGMELHHDCGNPGCVRPDHLRTVTEQEHKELSRKRRKRTTPLYRPPNRLSERARATEAALSYWEKRALFEISDPLGTVDQVIYCICKLNQGARGWNVGELRAAIRHRWGRDAQRRINIAAGELSWHFFMIAWNEYAEQHRRKRLAEGSEMNERSGEEGRREVAERGENSC
jgi:HNH endonuclease